MRPAQEALLSLVERIFEDGIVTPTERSELVSLYRDGMLTVSEVREVFSTFVGAMWADAIADGRITEEERARLAAIVRELRLPRECVPDPVAHLLRAA